MMITLRYMALLTAVILGVSIVLSAIIVFVPYGLWIVGGSAMVASMYMVAQGIKP